MKKTITLMLFAFLCIVGTSSAQNATTNPEAPSLSAGNTATATYPSVESQARNGVELRITHSDTQTIGGMIACGADGLTTINSYYRDFDLANVFGVVEDFIVDRVEFGVVVGSDIEPGTEVSVAIWAWDSGSTFPEGTGVELGRASYLSTAADQGTVVSVPLAATVPAGSVMVYEVTHAADTTFRIAGNEEGQTGVSWISTDGSCGLGGITDLAEIGFPTYSTVMNVWGYEATPLVYCGPLDFGTVEPITLVFGAGINNATSAVVGGTPATEDFTAIVGEMEQGGTYTIDIAGNTDGPFTDYFVIFMDWNQNGILNDEGEVYEYTETLNGSDGTDGAIVSNDIAVPADAALGETRMRVKKIYGVTDLTDPCVGATYGQAEDYTINVSAPIPPVELPITFEDGQTPLFTDFGGSATVIIPNPDASGINTTATVADNLVPAGVLFAGVTFPVAVDLTTDKYFKLQVWASEIGTPILVKLEGDGLPQEVSVATTTANQWEELVFDFSFDTGLIYTKVTLFMNFNTGAGNPDVTTYWDNLELFTPEPPAPDNDLCVDAEASTCSENTMNLDTTYATISAEVSICPDPEGNDIDLSVAPGVWYSLTIPADGDYMVACNTTGTLWDTVLAVYSGDCDDNLTCVVANDDNPSGTSQSRVEWIGSADETYLIYLTGFAADDFGPALFTVEECIFIVPPVELPITFEDGQTPLFGDFGGSATTIIPNPDASGINTTATVADNLVPAGLLFAGVNFPVAVDLTTDKYFKLQVWASEIGTPILVKLEGDGLPQELLVETTTANQWEELVFDFSFDTGLSYTSVTLFMNFNTGAGNPDVTTYWDNLELFTPEPVDYCGPLEFTVNVEPITLVLGAGINNASSAVVDGSPGTEDFTAIVGDMSQGGTFTMDIEGNTAGNWENRFVIFIDWNQNGILDDEGEVYEYTETLTNSDGTDGQFVSNDIVVPVDAALGETRMRVKKIYGTTAFLDPCLGTAYGQAEDYTISVGVLSTNDNVIEGFSYYPNPSSDVINLSAKQNIEKAAIYNILGQKVIDQNINATSSRLNVANLNTGTYLMQVTVDGKTATYKILKN